jgi:hypothetical protein
MKETIELQDLAHRIEAIEQRNKRVELDKAWEGSITRKVTIIITTYFVVLIFMIMTKNNQPFINAIVPSIGFFLSTLVVSSLKKHWVRKRQ